MSISDFYAYSEQKNKPSKDIDDLQEKDILGYNEIVKNAIKKFLADVYKQY